MNNVTSSINFSLFVGWSAVVEDVKAMNQFVIGSKLDVHREKLKENVVFFDPANEIQLAEIMMEFSKKPPLKLIRSYKENILAFGQKFTEIARELIQS